MMKLGKEYILKMIVIIPFQAVIFPSAVTYDDDFLYRVIILQLVLY